ncbi:MAG: cohesin domain-containing protein [Methylococcaceae bacterium]
MLIFRSTKILQALTLTGIMLGAFSGAQAAMVQFSPVPAIVTPGSTFTLDILATDFPEILGGGLAITVGNSSVLQINSARYSSPFWDTDFSNNGIIDPETVSGLGFGKFAGASGSFTIGSVSFTALSSGTSELSLTEDSFIGGFTFSVDPGPNIIFSPSTITVTAAPVPIPAAFWLFASVMGVMGMSFKKSRRV